MSNYALSPEAARRARLARRQNRGSSILRRAMENSSTRSSTALEQSDTPLSQRERENSSTRSSTALEQSDTPLSQREREASATLSPPPGIGLARPDDETAGTDGESSSRVTRLEERVAQQDDKLDSIISILEGLQRSGRSDARRQKRVERALGDLEERRGPAESIPMSVMPGQSQESVLASLGMPIYSVSMATSVANLHFSPAPSLGGLGTVTGEMLAAVREGGGKRDWIVKAANKKDHPHQVGAKQVLVFEQSVYRYLCTLDRSDRRRLELSCPDVIGELLFGLDDAKVVDLVMKLGVDDLRIGLYIANGIASAAGSVSVLALLKNGMEEFEFLLKEKAADDDLTLDGFKTVLEDEFKRLNSVLRGHPVKVPFDADPFVKPMTQYALQKASAEVLRRERQSLGWRRPGTGTRPNGKGLVVPSGKSSFFSEVSVGGGKIVLKIADENDAQFGCPQPFGLYIDRKPVVWQLALGRDVPKKKQTDGVISSFDGVSKAQYAAAIDRLQKWRASAYDKLLSEAGVEGGHKAWLLGFFDAAN